MRHTGVIAYLFEIPSRHNATGMPDPFLQRYLPTRESIREYALFRFLGHRLLQPELWHLHRRSVGGAFFIGLFCAFLPIPTQMLIAALMALIGRCNIPISIGVTWITNPLTMGPMFFFAYKLGAWLLDTQVTITTVELSFSWLSNQISQIWWPLLVGCLICGWVAGLSGMLVSRILWRLHVVRHWKQRLARRKAVAPS